MKLNKIAFAVAAVFAAGTAHAAIDPFIVPTLDIFLSGASAVQINLTNQLGTLFVSTGADAYVYLVDSDTNGSDYRAIVGKLNAGAIPGILGGTVVRIVYRARGGSAIGVNPVAKAEPIERMKITGGVGGNCTILGSPAYGDTTTPDYTCTVDITGTDFIVPHFGVSEVEPAMYQAPFNVEYDPLLQQPKPALTNIERTTAFTGTIKPLHQQAFGLPVTDSVATTVKLDKAMFASMMAAGGVIRNWSQVAGSGKTANDPVVVCRQVQGAQAMANIFFTGSNGRGFPCNSPSNTSPTRMADSAGYQAAGDGTTANPYIIDPSYGYTVVENPSSGNVRSCMTAANAGTNWKFRGDDNKWYEVTFSGTGPIGYVNGDPAVVKPFEAIGVLSYDSAGLENGWHYHDEVSFPFASIIVPVNASGRPATSTAKYALAAMMESPWEYFSEVTMQRRNVTVKGVVPLTGDYLDFFNGFVALLGNPAAMTTSVINKGVAALPDFNVPTGSVVTNKVSKGSKGGDSCAPKKLKYDPIFW